MALQLRKPQNTIKPAKTLGEMLILRTLNYASLKKYSVVTEKGVFQVIG